MNTQTKDYYYIGNNKEGDRVWLRKPSWECKWYWGFGYLQTMIDNKEPSKAKDVKSHTHWDCCVNHSNKNAHDWFIATFGEPTTGYNCDNPHLVKHNRRNNRRKCRFTDTQIWRLCELMDTAYSLRKVAAILESGSSNYTINPCAKVIKNTREAKRINSKVLLAIFMEIGKIFDEVDHANTPSKPFIGLGWCEPTKKLKKVSEQVPKWASFIF